MQCFVDFGVSSKEVYTVSRVQIQLHQQRKNNLLTKKKQKNSIKKENLPGGNEPEKGLILTMNSVKIYIGQIQLIIGRRDLQFFYLYHPTLFDLTFICFIFL